MRVNVTSEKNNIYIGFSFIDYATKKILPTHKVILHDLPEYNFFIVADDCDSAQAKVFNFVQSTKGGLKTNAATIQSV